MACALTTQPSIVINPTPVYTINSALALPHTTFSQNGSSQASRVSKKQYMHIKEPERKQIKTESEDMKLQEQEIPGGQLKNEFIATVVPTHQAHSK